MARKRRPSDLVIRGARIANVFTHLYEEMDLAIASGRIVGIGHGYEGHEVVDARGTVLIPGMIDGHVHIESTMLTPSTFASAVVPLGTTAVMADPHEIVNTCGMKGLEFMAQEARMLPLDILLAVPSCVPASEFETPFEIIDATHIEQAFRRGWGNHLGEMMNYPGVIAGTPEVWSRVLASGYRVRTGHAPGVSGRDLNAYLLTECNSDHENNSAAEALEKARRGMWVMIREGATERNLDDVIELLRSKEWAFTRCMAVSDDLTARYLLEMGHMDRKLRALIKNKIPPFRALSMVTLNPSQYFRLWDRGAIAPGYLADVVMVDSIEQCHVQKVWKRGKLVAENGKPLFDFPPILGEAPVSNRGFEAPSREQLVVQASENAFVRVIIVQPGKVTTDYAEHQAKVVDGYAVPDPNRDLAQLVVADKNTCSGRVAIGFAQGFGLKKGALASSVAHDAHNYIVVGTDTESIETGFRYLAENGGGIAVALKDQVLASLPLPVGGLMCLHSPQETADKLAEIDDAATQLGVTLPHPFMALSFLSLSVIPELKLTDKGYVDFTRGGALGLFVGEEETL